MRAQTAILTISVSGGVLAGGGVSGGALAQETSPSALESIVDTGLEASAAVYRAFAALDPALRGMLVALLAAWIEDTRDTALARGVDEIPRDVRDALTGHVPDEILGRVRWRVDDSLLSVEQSLFRMGYTSAVTLDHVVIFRNRQDVGDPELWAHELVHVTQYRDWGVDGFAERYVADHEAVERDAAKFRWEWARAAGRVPQPVKLSSARE